MSDVGADLLLSLLCRDLQLSKELALNQLLGLQQPAGAGALGPRHLSGAAQKARVQQQLQSTGVVVANGGERSC